MVEHNYLIKILKNIRTVYYANMKTVIGNDVFSIKIFDGDIIEITGIKSNKEFFNIYSGKVEVPKGFEIIEVGEIPENFQKQGFRTDGKLIGTKNGEGFPKKLIK